MASGRITVVGAGIFGLSVAWALARRGAVVRVVEVARIGAGASGGLVGAMAPHVPQLWNAKKAFQFDSLLLAGAWWAGVSAAAGLASGYGRTGRLQALADAAAVEQARVREGLAADLWRGAARWRVVRAKGSAWEPVSASGWLIEDDLCARIQPRMALAALVGAVRAKGGVVEEGVQWEADTGVVVWATGVAGLAALGQGRGEKGQALTVRFDAGDAPQMFAEGVHIVPHVDGTVAIGSTTERDWLLAAATDARLDALHRKAVAICPALAGAPVVERWAGLRPRSATRAPVLGAWPGRDGHFVANGGFKIGFGMAPKIAEVMADLVLEGRDAIPDGFRLPPLAQ